MSIKITPQLKVGAFVAIILFILGYMTLQIGQHSFVPGGTYTLYLLVDSAAGINDKTPVQVAGIEVGTVEGIELIENVQARLALRIRKQVKLSGTVEAKIKTTGFLGDTYIELVQKRSGEPLKDGSTVISNSTGGDLTNQLTDIASDVKAITTTMKSLMAGDDSSFAKTLRNVEQISESLKNVSVNNEGNLNSIIANLKDVSINLNRIVANNQANVNATLDNVAAITQKVNDGEGTIGKLVNDETTINKINESLDNLNGVLGSANKMQVGIGYHNEYLGTTKDFKNYVDLSLKPRPDKYFVFEFVSDPAPAPVFSTKKTKITSGGKTTSVTESTQVIDKDKFLFSAQFAKQYYGFTFRGGLIESSGGFGIDYNYGPIGLKFSAFHFKNNEGQKPHLKGMGTLNLTKSIYLLGGLDDFISNEHDPDWFIGAGLHITDDDLKSLFGLMSLKP